MAATPRYVLSERAASALRELIAPGASYGSRPRPAHDAPLPRPMPFDTAVRRDEAASEPHLWCYLPPRITHDVTLDDTAIAPASGQTIGTAAAPWVDLGAYDPSLRLWLVVMFPSPASGGGMNPAQWSLAYQASPPQSPPPDAVVQLAACDVLASDGQTPRLVQHHHGTVELSGDPCLPGYELVEQTAGECEVKRIALRVTPYTKDASGRCQPGTPQTITPIGIPAPPEYGLSVAAGASACQRVVTLQRKPCGGSPQQAGDALTFDIPPAITATSTGSTESGALAGTVTLTTCTGSQTVINVYNGAQGAGASITGTFLTGVDSFGISGGALTIVFTTVTYPGGVPGTLTKSVPATGC